MVHAEQVLEMGDEHATSFDVVLVEVPQIPRPHNFEEDSRLSIPGKDGAEPMMQILRLQPLGIEPGPHQLRFRYQLLADVNLPGRAIVAFVGHPSVVTREVQGIGVQILGIVSSASIDKPTIM
jgi:hypothetical protein